MLRSRVSLVVCLILWPLIASGCGTAQERATAYGNRHVADAALAVEAKPEELAFADQSSVGTMEIVETAVDISGGQTIATAHFAGAALPNRSLRIGLGDVDLASLDPAAAATPSELIAADLLYDGLTTTVAGTDIVLGDLADLWGTVGDASRWEFVLRERTFASGDFITAQHVKDSIEKAVWNHPDSAGAQALSHVVGWQDFVDGTANEITGIQAISTASIRFQLDASYEFFPIALSHPGLGVVDVTDLTNTSGIWSVEAGPVRRWILTSSPSDHLNFDEVQIISHFENAASAEAFNVGAVDIGIIDSDPVQPVHWRPNIMEIATRGDGTFDVTAVGSQP